MSNGPVQDYPAARKQIVVNADDFGLSAGVNRGIIEAHENGIVTSTSLMVRWPAAAEARDLARSYPRLGVGLHVDLGEWMLQNWEWVPLYEVVDQKDPLAVEAEIRRQLQAFIDLMGRQPTHIDSHQHVHRNPHLAPIAQKIAAEARIVLRHFHPRVTYCGNFYGQDNHAQPYHQAITSDALARTIRELTGPITEVACHPGYGEDLNTMYRIEREMELRALCDPDVRRAIEESGLELVNFSAVGSP